MNNRWSNSNSSTVEARLKINPEEWYLYRETRAGWEEQPAEHIASHLAPAAISSSGTSGAESAS